MFIVSRPRYYDFAAEERAAELAYIRRRRALEQQRRREAALAFQRRREAALAIERQHCALENAFNFANEFNRLSSFVLDDAFTSFFPKVNKTSKLEFSENEDEYKFALRLAEGLNKDNLTINVTEDRVTIEGKVGFDTDTESSNDASEEDVMETESKGDIDLTEDGLVEDFVDVSPDDETSPDVPTTKEVAVKDDTEKDIIPKETVKRMVYKRSFTLPEDSDIESLKAKFGENVLTLTVQKKKAPVVTPREIVIE